MRRSPARFLDERTSNAYLMGGEGFFVQVFQALWRSYGSEEAFLAKHSRPALVLEPFLEEESTHLTRPGAALGSSINDLLKA